MAIQADGKIVVVGYVQSIRVDWDFAVARLNTDGSLDTSFDNDGKQTIDFNLGLGSSDYARDVAIQADSKIVLVGVPIGTSFVDDFGVARLNRRPADTSFDNDGKQTIHFNPGVYVRQLC